MSHQALSGFVPQQAHFDFLPAIIVANLTQKNISSQERADKARQRRLVTPSRVKVLGTDDEILQIPLDLLERPILVGELIEGTLSPAFREMQEDLGDVLSANAEAPQEAPNAIAADEVMEWSDAAVAQLHEGLLYSSLAVLGGRGNATEKVEVLRWFLRPDIYCWKQRPQTNPDATPAYQPVYASSIPFTYQRCCALIGLDHGDLLERLLFILRKAGLGQYLPN